MRKATIFCALFPLFLISCVGGVLLNKSYTFPKYGKISLAILPVKKNQLFSIDSIFTDIFTDTTNKYELFDPIQISQLSENNGEFKNAISKLLNLDIVRIDSTNKMLITHLNQGEIDILKSNLPGSRLLLSPSVFKLRQSGDAIIGTCNVLLIDVSIGELIYSKKESFNVFPDGSLRSGGLISMSEGQEIDASSIKTARYCTALLAAEASTDFINNYLIKFR
jgi:hypothetical protein